MCGILGFVGNIDFELEDFYKANNLMSHRGPDDSGTWRSDKGNVLLGHRRLSILDLSSRGSQPMQSQSQRFVISFNGEIYNHLDIRKKLESEFDISSQSWRGSSDTETILACIELYGFEEALDLFTGMFSLGV